MFDGKVGGIRTVNAGAKRGEAKTSKDLVEKARREREQRAVLRQRNDAAKKIQTLTRKVQTQQKWFKEWKFEFDRKIKEILSLKAMFKAKGAVFNVPVAVIQQLLRSFLVFFRVHIDIDRCSIVHDLLFDSYHSTDPSSRFDNISDPTIFARSLHQIRKIWEITMLVIASPLSTADIVMKCSTFCAVVLCLSESTAEERKPLVHALLTSGMRAPFSALRELCNNGRNACLEFRISALVSICQQFVIVLPQFPSSYAQSLATVIGAYILTIPSLDDYTAVYDLASMIAQSSLIVDSQQAIDNMLNPAALQAKGKNKGSTTIQLSRLGNFTRHFLSSSSSSSSVVSLVYMRQVWLQSMQQVLTVTSDLPLAAACNPPVALLSSTAMDVDEDSQHEQQQQQQQQQQVEYSTADGTKKLAMRSDLILRDLAEQETHRLQQQQSGSSIQTLTKSVQVTMQVLSSPETISSIFNTITPTEGGDSLPSQLSMISLYAKCLLVLPIKPQHATAAAVTRESFLNSLAFATPQEPIVHKLWMLITSPALYDFFKLLFSVDFNSFIHASVVVAMAQRLGLQPGQVYESLLNVLFLFAAIFTQQLGAIDDEEFLIEQIIFPVEELVKIVVFLRQWLLKVYWIEPVMKEDLHIFMSSSSSQAQQQQQQQQQQQGYGLRQVQVQQPASPAYSQLLQHACLLTTTQLFNRLCIRHERRRFLPTDDLYQWSILPVQDLALVDHTSTSTSTAMEEALEDAPPGEFLVRNPAMRTVLMCIPQVIAFSQRVVLFHALVDRDKEDYIRSLPQQSFEEMISNHHVARAVVRRDHLIEDAVKGLDHLQHRLKGRVQVEFISEQGFQEAGIDGGGLFKEFMDSFAKAISDPMTGLFIPTTGEGGQKLTPNPASAMLGEHHLALYAFAGKMIGKALYEKILFESELASGFLNMLLGRSNELDDMYQLDSEVYRSVMQLKRYGRRGGDIDALELYFTTEVDQYGARTTHDLIPHGHAIKVTSHNLLNYIHRLAHFKQNTLIRDQSRAFLRGFRTMIPLPWLRMFNTKELQLLISGDNRRIDIADMMKNTNYGSGYHESQLYIQAFWSIVEQMTQEEQGELLMFVTSCPRQPLLGFKELQPKFCIQQVSPYHDVPLGSDVIPLHEQPRLPTAATCMNLLKLPRYRSVEMLREKLLYAIKSHSGFELS